MKGKRFLGKKREEITRQLNGDLFNHTEGVAFNKYSMKNEMKNNR